MPICMQLSQSALTNLLAQGATLNGGPFTSEADCLANCGSSSSSSSGGNPTVTSPCCGSTPIPVNLMMSLSIISGSCNCMSGKTITLTWTSNAIGSFQPGWVGTDPTCCPCNFTDTDMFWVLVCNGTTCNDFSLTAFCGDPVNAASQVWQAVNGSGLVSCSCSPFSFIGQTSVVIPCGDCVSGAVLKAVVTA